MKNFLLLLLLISFIPAMTGFSYSPADMRVNKPVGHLSISTSTVKIEADIYFSVYNSDIRQWDRSIWDGGDVAWLDDTEWITADVYNTVLVSHTDGPLHDILWLAVGDYVYIYDDQYMATYQVTETIIRDVTDILSVTDQVGGPRMTMSICWGNEQRYIVRADRIRLETITAVG